MPSIYARGNRIWCRLKVAGEWTSSATPFNVGDEDKARRYARAAQEKIDQRELLVPTGPLTLRRYVEQWLRRREFEGHDWKRDRGKLDKHVLPELGGHELGALRAVHIAALVRRLRFQSDPTLAPRTVRNVYSVLAASLRDAQIEGLIDASPCILTEAQLGPVVDKDREWRTGALFTRDEAEQLISDPRIPMDRQLVYGFGLLAGMRPGEAAALRWRMYDARAEPLGRLTVASSYSTCRSAVKGTKTEAVRAVPVHSTLAAMLAEWRLAGWAAMMGRLPNDDDLILPLPPATIERRTRRTGDPFRGYDYTGRRWRDIDLPLLGWRDRSVYDTKATFITLVIEDGADPAIIRDRVTHTKPRRDAFTGYDRGSHWVATCREVAKLQLRRLATPLATVIELSSGSERSGGGFRILDREHDDHTIVRILDGAGGKR